MLENQHHFLTMCTWDALNVNADDYRKCLNNLKLWERPRAKTFARSYDVEGNAKKCVERYCELANQKTGQLYKVSTL